MRNSHVFRPFNISLYILSFSSFTWLASFSLAWSLLLLSAPCSLFPLGSLLPPTCTLLLTTPSYSCSLLPAPCSLLLPAPCSSLLPPAPYCSLLPPPSFAPAPHPPQCFILQGLLQHLRTSSHNKCKQSRVQYKDYINNKPNECKHTGPVFRKTLGFFGP